MESPRSPSLGCPLHLVRVGLDLSGEHDLELDRHGNCDQELDLELDLVASRGAGCSANSICGGWT